MATPTKIITVQAWPNDHQEMRQFSRDSKIPSPVLVSAMWKAFRGLDKDKRARLLSAANKRRVNIDVPIS
jgi:hypothetical protein